MLYQLSYCPRKGTLGYQRFPKGRVRPNSAVDAENRAALAALPVFQRVSLWTVWAR